MATTGTMVEGASASSWSPCPLRAPNQRVSRPCLLSSSDCAPCAALEDASPFSPINPFRHTICPVTTQYMGSPSPSLPSIAISVLPSSQHHCRFRDRSPKDATLHERSSASHGLPAVYRRLLPLSCRFKGDGDIAQFGSPLGGIGRFSGIRAFLRRARTAHSSAFGFGAKIAVQDRDAGIIAGQERDLPRLRAQGSRWAKRGRQQRVRPGLQGPIPPTVIFDDDINTSWPASTRKDRKRLGCQYGRFISKPFAMPWPRSATPCPGPRSRIPGVAA